MSEVASMYDRIHRLFIRVLEILMQFYDVCSSRFFCFCEDDCFTYSVAEGTMHSYIQCHVC